MSMANEAIGISDEMTRVKRGKAGHCHTTNSPRERVDNDTAAMMVLCGGVQYSELMIGAMPRVQFN